MCIFCSLFLANFPGFWRNVSPFSPFPLAATPLVDSIVILFVGGLSPQALMKRRHWLRCDVGNAASQRQVSLRASAFRHPPPASVASAADAGAEEKAASPSTTTTIISRATKLPILTFFK